MRFRAAILHSVGQPLTVEQVEVSGLRPGDVLVRLRASGLCHTDLEVIEGALAYPLPIVLGHEGAGVVEAVGPGVSLVAPGDHVVCSWNPNCGHCFYCDRDQPILCEPFTRHQPQGRLLDGGGRLSLDGGPLHHYSMVCSHAEYCVVPESGAIKVPAEIPFDRACLIGCGVMTGVGAVLRVARATIGESVAVVGCGAVGLNAIQGARLAGCEPIIAVDVTPERLAMAEAFGAQAVLNGRTDDVPSRVRSMTRGRGADHVFEAAGITASLQTCFDAVRPGGNLVILGKTSVDSNVGLRWGSMMGEKRIVRSSYGGARPRRDFPLLAQLYLDGKLMLDELITTRLALDGINAGFDLMRQGAAVRSVIELAD
jgi:S-(hydroxymethyl)glutathione dehydrogenase / alcohol dehydrogenase